MSKSKAAVVSDSSLLGSALESALSAHFSSVLILSELDGSLTEEDWGQTVLVIDATYPKKTLEELERLSSPLGLQKTVILLRGKQNGAEFAGLAGRVGAILPNSCTIDEIALTARLVREGLAIVPTELLPFLGDDTDHAFDLNSKQLELLTERESKVLALICQGSGNKAIARNLNISDSTVRVHVRSILRKLGLQNRTQAALRAHTHIAQLLNHND